MNDTADRADPPPLEGAVPLLDAAGKRAADAEAQRRGIASLLLMERAGVEAALAILECYPGARSATVLVGPGNNGGDGMVVARRLHEAGLDIRAFSRDGEPPGTPDGLTVSTASGVHVGRFDPRATPAPADVVVDAILGTGQTGDLRAPIDAMCRWANDQPAPVVALDLPTGVNADTGAAAADAVRASLTVTFHADTLGLRLAPGRGLAGDVRVVPIGVPRDHRDRPAAWGVDSRAVRAVPPKGEGGDKYAAGAVLVVGGSRGMSGAARLAATACLRAGAGLVTAAVPADVADLVAGGRAEVMVDALHAHGGHLAPGDVADMVARAGRFAAVAVGPGMGRHDDSGPALRDLLASLDMPAVVDADGLWHLVGHVDGLGRRSAPTVITPHAGEAARLLGVPRGDVDAARLDVAAELARLSGATVVLKGPGTIVAAEGHAPLVCLPGGPELATAGSGDVLTGVVAAFLARGVPARVAAGAAVAIHARAGALAGRGDGTLAGDVADALPAAVAEGRGA
ncbi:MAG: NAD(P)H-hydrate dehydratase [Thermoleophilia bacterium]|nr:NAD(P)H-hydrate dehydratase [Thermoleophilia bacterium]